jgi:hypothetical protein
MTQLRIERCVAAAQAGAPVECRPEGTPFDTPPELSLPAAAAHCGSDQCPRAH